MHFRVFVIYHASWFHRRQEAYTRPRSTDKVLLSSRSTCIWNSSKWAIRLCRHFHAWYMSPFQSGFLTINTNLCCWTEVADSVSTLFAHQTLLGRGNWNDGENSFNDFKNSLKTNMSSWLWILINIRRQHNFVLIHYFCHTRIMWISCGYTYHSLVTANWSLSFDDR